MILDRIHSVEDIKKLNLNELNDLAHDIREYILDIISQNGGHLASSLGVVELTIAMHYVFNAPSDKIIWDVGHQCYAHKILTGRKKLFGTIRRFGGISGFPKMKESKFDTFNVGHSSTSLSLAHGLAVGRDLTGKDHKVVAVIGDGSLTGGIAFEALNHIGHMDNDLIIILNDNEHSISKNVGAVSQYLTRMISGTLYNKFRRKSMELIKRIPLVGMPIFNFLYRFFESFKAFLLHGQLFEDMGVRYFGPIDGHDINFLIKVLEKVKKINYGAKLIHVITRKGKGYLPAEMDPARFHGIGPFDRASGISKQNKYLTYSEVTGKTLAHIARTDKKIIAITAAMKLGTGLYEFENCAPDRFFDVGIAEQHAITFAGSIATTGMKPFVSIYSTFLQRAVDQLIHDIAIMNLPVRLLIDRSGIVGEDGETHHGLFDIAIIKNIPNFILLAPSSGDELRDMIYFAVDYDSGPIAIRFPRGRIVIEQMDFAARRKFVPGKIKRLTSGRDLAIFTFGDMVKTAMEVREILEEKKIRVSVVNLLTIKPLDIRGIEGVIGSAGLFITLENGIVTGGAGEYILANIKPHLRKKLLFCAGFPDVFVTHGTNRELFKEYGLDARSLARKIIRQRGKPGR